MGSIKDVVVRRLNGRIWIKEVVQRRVQFERVIVGMRMMIGLGMQRMMGLRMRLRMRVVIEGMIELMT